MRRGFLLAVGLAAVLGLAPTPAGAIPFTYSSGVLSASVDFIQSGSNLIVTLTNTSTANVNDPSQVLTAVFFTLDGVLTPDSAVLGANSSVLFAPSSPVSGSLSPAGPDVGGEWAYATGLVGAPEGATQGIGSVGLGTGGVTEDLFQATNRFRTDSNLQGPDGLDGLQYGITSVGDDPSCNSGNAAVCGSNALIQYSVVFTLSGLPNGFVLSRSMISDVFFQYGTELAQIPEPATLLLLGSGLMVLGLLGRRTARASKRTKA